jgi:hypothetical protein
MVKELTRVEMIWSNRKALQCLTLTQNTLTKEHRKSSTSFLIDKNTVRVGKDRENYILIKRRKRSREAFMNLMIKVIIQAMLAQVQISKILFPSNQMEVFSISKWLINR